MIKYEITNSNLLQSELQNEEQVMMDIEKIIKQFDLIVTQKSTLSTKKGSVHYHLKRGKSKGVLELTYWPAMRGLWVEIHDNRSAEWNEELIYPFSAALAKSFSGRLLNQSDLKQMDAIDSYLKPSTYIDYENSHIQELITSLKLEHLSEIDAIRTVFEYVRDEISHSYDIKNSEVTAKASEVLVKKHGICYAKSHLVSALLRGVGIHSGICYQKLILFDKPEDGYCIHALNTVYITSLNRWIRLDARGNKEGIDAQFSIGNEKLAFSVREELGETDYRINYSEPHSEIIRTLEAGADCLIMYKENLPEDLD
jgi:transglutaminase-like putative cysteine protease